MELPRRKNVRLRDYDYSHNGLYFVTVCVKNRLKILWETSKDSVGCDAHIAPSFEDFDI